MRISYLITSLCGVLLSGTFLCGILQRPSPAIDRKVAGQHRLRPDWIEIKLEQPLKPVGDYQELGLILAEPFEMELLGPTGVRIDGLLVVPEVELLTADGSSAPMKCSGQRGKTMMTFRLKDESVKQDYDRIRIRAAKEIPVKSIYWTGIVIKNMH